MSDISTWTWPTIFVALVALALITVLVGLIAYALLKSSSLPAPALLVVSMSMLTLVLVVIYAITKESDLLTLVGVPVGALAAATSSVYVAQHTPMQQSRVTVAGSTTPGQESPAMTIDLNPTGPATPHSTGSWAIDPQGITPANPVEGSDDDRGA